MNQRLIDKLSSIRFIQFIGDISYSIYLLHFIVISFVFRRLFVTLKVRFIIVFALTFLLATLSYYLVERTFKKVNKKRLVYACFFISLLLILLFSVQININAKNQSIEFAQNSYNELNNPNNFCLGAKAVINKECPTPYGDFGLQKKEYVSKFVQDEVSKLTGGNGVLANDSKVFNNEFVRTWTSKPWQGTFEANDFGFDKDLLLIGNSHAYVLSSVIQDVAKENGYNFKAAYNISFIPGVSCIPNPNDETVLNLNNEFYNSVVKNSAKVIISVQTDQGHIDRCPGFSHVDMVKKMNSLGIKPIILEDNFSDGKTYKECKIFQTVDKCRMPIDESLFRMDRLKIELDKAKVPEENYTYLLQRDLECDKDYCYYYIGGVPLTFDDSHLSGEFLITAKDYFKELFKPEL